MNSEYHSIPRGGKRLTTWEDIDLYKHGGGGVLKSTYIAQLDNALKKSYALKIGDVQSWVEYLGTLYEYFVFTL